MRAGRPAGAGVAMRYSALCTRIAAMPITSRPYSGTLGGAISPDAQGTAFDTHAARRRERGKPLVIIVNPGGARERGGMGGTVRYLVEAWQARPDAPRVLVLDSRGLGSVLFAPLFLALTLLRIVVARLTDEVALIHVNMAENTSVLRKGLVVFAGRLLRIPVLLHLHAGLFIDFYRRLPAPARLFTRIVFRAADRIIVLGELWKRMLVKELGIASARIAVVYNGVPALPPRAGAMTNAPCRLLYVGKLRNEKGLSVLLRALSSARLKEMPWTLTLVGTGERKHFEGLAGELALGGRVQFSGWLESAAVRRILAAADVYVLPSYYEGLPLGLLEALSGGLAVVTTPVGALPEVLRDGESALLVPPGDVAALEEALFRLVTDAALRARLQQAARRLYEARFTLAQFVAAIEAEYRRIVRARASGAAA